MYIFRECIYSYMNNMPKFNGFFGGWVGDNVISILKWNTINDNRMLRIFSICFGLIFSFENNFTG